MTGPFLCPAPSTSSSWPCRIPRDGGTPTPLWPPILMARLYRGKRNRGAEEPMKLLLRPRSNPALAATVIAVPIAMMTRSCGLPGKLDERRRPDRS